MFNFEKTHEYLVCIDSDGTIMDTMTSKHEVAFGPAFLEVFNIKENSDIILKEWLDINLYTKTRGINRFKGLLMILKFVEKYGYTYEGLATYEKWVKETKSHSMPSLKEEIENVSDNNCLKLALRWSELVNKKIEAMPQAKPFEVVVDALNILKQKVDLLGVSSANYQAVLKEWEIINIKDDFKEIACQDKGTKANIIKQALERGYDKDKVVMLGDALGDLEAAKEAGVLFFPIIPRFENTSWDDFIEIGLNKLLNNTFKGTYQDSLIDKFLKFLSK